MNILCFGDSNTYGYKPDGTGRFDTDTRWTSLLQKKLGADHRVIEEGLCGRTTVFQDDLREGRRGLDLIGVTMEMHNPIDLLIVMLGTNDCKQDTMRPQEPLPKDWLKSSKKPGKMLPSLLISSSFHRFIWMKVLAILALIRNLMKNP